MENKLKQQDIDDREQIRNQRKLFALLIFGFICVWSFLIISIVFLKGFSPLTLNISNKKIILNFELSESIILTLLRTTFFQVLGLFWIVMSYLFPNGKNK